jgi:hypothetical protein
MRDEDGITIVNHAKDQWTLADYELAQEEYQRKKAMVRAAREGGAQPARASTASSIAARMDRADNIRQLKELLAQPGMSQEDRNTLERRLHDEEMALAFTPR